MEAIIVSLIGAAISLATFVYTLVANSHKASFDKVARLEAQLDGMEERLAQCEEDRHSLRMEIYHVREQAYATAAQVAGK